MKEKEVNFLGNCLFLGVVIISTFGFCNTQLQMSVSPCYGPYKKNTKLLPSNASSILSNTTVFQLISFSNLFFPITVFHSIFICMVFNCEEKNGMIFLYKVLP